MFFTSCKQASKCKKHISSLIIFFIRLVLNRKTLICDACELLGCTPRDAALYTCSHCSKEWGAGRYDSSQLKRYKNKRQKKIVCEVCAGAEDEDSSNRVYESTTPEVICHMHSDGGTPLPRCEFSRTTLNHASANLFHCCTKCEERRNHLQQKVSGTKIRCDCPEYVHQASRRVDLCGFRE